MTCCATSCVLAVRSQDKSHVGIKVVLVFSQELAVVPAHPTVLSCSKAVLGTVFSPLFRVFGHHGQHHAPAGAAAAATTVVVCQEEEEEEQHEEDGKENATDAAHAHQHHHHAHHPPPPEVPEAAESDYEEDEDEEEYADFDPLVFIKSLPPLEQCTPKFRQALLPRQTRQCKRKVCAAGPWASCINACCIFQLLTPHARRPCMQPRQPDGAHNLMAGSPWCICSAHASHAICFFF